MLFSQSFVHILSKIQSSANFKYLNFDIQHYWSNFVFMDSANYGGMHIENIEDADLDLTNANNVSIIKNQAVYRYNFSVANYLPKVGNMRRNFLSIVENYVKSIANNQNDSLQNRGFAVGNTPVVRRNHNDSSILDTQDEKNIEDKENINAGPGNFKSFAVNYINTTLQGQVVSAIEMIKKGVKREKNVDNYLTGNLPGTLGAKTEPSLDFIKVICRVLELDDLIKPQIAVMKNNLLRIVGVGAFAPKAEWSEMSSRKVIIDLICNFCSNSNDIDICTDLKLLSAIENGDEPEFTCQHCQSILPNAHQSVELSLLQEMKTSIASYLTQDIKCQKCNGVCGTFLKRNCPKDARRFVNNKCSQDLTTELAVLRQICKAYKFEILEENLEFLTLPIN